jgi:hypothetical protein
MERNELKSCCFKLDLAALIVFVSIFFVSAAILLSVYKLVIEKDCNNTTPYYILLTNQASLAAAVLFNLIKKKQQNE